MSLLSNIVTPGYHGKIFETNATIHQHLEEIKKVILNIRGVKDVIVNEEKFPREIIIHTNSLVTVKDIE